MDSAVVKDSEGPESSYDLEATILAALLQEKVTKSIGTNSELPLEIGLRRLESLWLACLDYFVSRLPATTRAAIQRSGLPAHLLPTAIPQQTQPGVLPSEILLLVLEPSEDPSTIVKCRLCTARPEPIPRPRYRVLSYDWGDPAKTRRISLSGTITEVTKNLESGLRHLRQQHEPCCVWVDPLCIDHRHGQTRGSSTEALRYIYARAQEVIVWLGDASETSARAFRCVNHLATEDIAAQCFLVQHELHHLDLYPELPCGLGAFMKLMERRWWDRAGLVQLLMHGCKVLVHCGGSTADWNSFTRLFEVLQEKEPMVRNRNVRYLRKVFQAVYVLAPQVFVNLPPAMSIEERPVSLEAFLFSIERSFKGAKLGVSWVLALSKVASLCGSILTGLAEKLCSRSVDRIRMALFQDPTLRQRGEGRRSPKDGAEASANGFLGRKPSAPPTLSGPVAAETHRMQKVIEPTFLAADSHHQSELQCWLRVLKTLSTSHASPVAPAEQVAAGSPFIYEPLDPAAKEFRILLLKSIAETDVQPDSRVDCELIPADLNLLSRLGIRKCPFVSISRDWGELVSQARIFVHGREKAINPALYADLRNLRHPSDDTLYWIPPICIDQDNAQEKALQASLKTLVDQHSGYMWSEDRGHVHHYINDMTSAAFKYSPLASDRLIRLIKFQNNPQADCEMIHVDIDEAPAYVALSYTWGLPGIVDYITIKGKRFGVSRNLIEPLVFFNYHHSDTYFWADAICINQEDLAERSSQILLMKSIYERAKWIAAWLGPSSPETIFAMEKIREWDEYIESLRKEHNGDLLSMENVLTPENEKIWGPVGSPAYRGWSAISELCLRDWWSRAWVMQEATTPRRLHIHCGLESWVVFRRFMSISFIAHAILKHPGLHIVRNFDRGESAQLFELQRCRRRNSTPTLLEVLQIIRRCKCTDPRDRVYAALGILSDSAKANIIPDYSQTLENVYLGVVKYVLEHYPEGHRLDFLGYVLSPAAPKDSEDDSEGTQQSIAAIPSWVPDWRTSTVGDIIPDFFHQSYKAPDIHPDHTDRGDTRQIIDEAHSIMYNASGGFATEARICERTLIVSGFMVDTIIKVSLIREDWSPQPAGIVHFFKIPYPTGESSETAYRATLVTDTTRALFTQSQYRRRRFGLFDINEVVPLSRGLFWTRSGYIGVGSVDVLVGDCVVGLFGGQVLYILRMCREEEVKFKFICECYVHGLMIREGLQLEYNENILQKIIFKII